MPSAVIVTGAFIAMEATNLLEYEIEGVKPLAMKGGSPTVTLSVDFDCPTLATEPEQVVDALRPAVHTLARAIKQHRIKRFFRCDLPHGAAIAHQCRTDRLVLTFLRFFDVEKYKMVNRLQILGAVRR